MTGAGEPPIHATSILLALILFLLGDKAFLIAQLGLKAYEGIRCDPAPEGSEFQVAIIGTAIGTCAVFLIAQTRKHVLKTDDLAILIGFLTATAAGFLDIAEAMWIDEAGRADAGNHPQRALFFYALWLALFVVPVIAAAAERGALGRPALRQLTITTASLLVGATLGFLHCKFAVAALLDPPSEGASGTATEKQLVFRIVMLVCLGAVWTVACFAPFRRTFWRVAYLLGAPVAAASYAMLFNSKEPFVVFGFALLAFAAVAPAAPFARAVMAGDRRALLFCALATAACCGAAMFVGLAGVKASGMGERLLFSGVHAISGALIPVAVYLGAALSRWRPTAPAASTPS